MRSSSVSNSGSGEPLLRKAFRYGLEINGIGLVIQDNYCWVDVRCTKSGSVSGYCDGGHNDPIFDIL